MIFLGLDLGGSYLKFIVEEDGQFFKDKLRVREIIAEGKLDELKDAIVGIILEHSPSAVGFAVAGFVEPPGFIEKSPNIPILNGVDMIKFLNLDIPTVIANDASLACLGEHKYGSAKGARCAVCLTLGTGLGGGLVIDSKLWLGVTGVAMEIGHTKISDEDTTCPCGRKGCAEEFVSSRAIVRYYKRIKGEEVSSADVINRAKFGEREAALAMEEFSESLSSVIMNIVHIINPDVVVLSGGIQEHYPEVVSLTRDRVKNRVIPSCAKGLKIEPAILGEYAGAWGALELAKDTHF